MIYLSFNPIALLLQVVTDLYPDAAARVEWVTGVEEGCGYTLWPDDGSETTIVIDVTLPMDGVIEVLAHECAHVVAGQEAEHGSAWEEAFEAIHVEYCKRIGV